MLRITTLVSLVAALALGSSSARAQEAVVPEGVMADEMRPVPSDVGVSATVGGGIENFTDQAPRDYTALAGSWNLRVALLTRFLVTPELAYVGSAQDIAAVGLDPNAFLLSNGGEADLRLNILTGMLQPYVFGGIGFRYYSIQNTGSNLSAIADNDTVGVVPVGGGMVFRIDQFLLDARGTYRFAFDDTMMSATGGTGLGMSSWAAELRAGVEI
jgi:hypothetical protein